MKLVDNKHGMRYPKTALGRKQLLLTRFVLKPGTVSTCFLYVLYSFTHSFPPFSPFPLLVTPLWAPKMCKYMYCTGQRHLKSSLWPEEVRRGEAYQLRLFTGRQGNKKLNTNGLPLILEPGINLTTKPLIVNQINLLHTVLAVMCVELDVIPFLSHREPQQN